MGVSTKGQGVIVKSNVSWTDEEVLLLKEYGTIKLPHELMEILPRRTALAISRKRKLLGMKLPNKYISKARSYNRSFLDENKLCKIDQSFTFNDLDNIVVQVLLGSMLGDGSVKINGKSPAIHRETNGCGKRNYIFSEGHCKSQKDYSFWKATQLSLFLPKMCSLKTKPGFITVQHPIFTMIRDKFYPSRQKCTKGILPMDLLDKLDLFGLMIWYLDDGYLGVPKDGKRNNLRCKNGSKWFKKPTPRIVGKGWNYEELLSLSAMINKKFDLSLNVSIHKDMNKIISIPAINRKRIFDQWRVWAKEYDIPECMYYKLNMHNQELLEKENKDNRYKLGK